MDQFNTIHHYPRYFYNSRIEYDFTDQILPALHTQMHVADPQMCRLPDKVLKNLSLSSIG